MLDSNKIPKKQRHITEAAIALFQRFGMKRVTVTEICERAKVSKMTFYKYFPNKVELTKYVLDILSEDILSTIDEIREMDIPFSEKGRLWIESGVKLAKELSPVFIEELYDIDDELKEYAQERSRKNVQYFTQFLADAQEKGEVRSDLSPEFIFLVLQKLNDLGRDNRALALYPNFTELTRATRTLFFYGILTPEGEP